MMGVYKHFNAEGEPLYIGASKDIESRNNTHRLQADWYEDSARMEVVECKTMEIAFEFEAREIERLQPLVNVTHNPRYDRCAPERPECDHPPFWAYEFHRINTAYANAPNVEARRVILREIGLAEEYWQPWDRE